MESSILISLARWRFIFFFFSKIVSKNKNRQIGIRCAPSLSSKTDFDFNFVALSRTEVTFLKLYTVRFKHFVTGRFRRKIISFVGNIMLIRTCFDRLRAKLNLPRVITWPNSLSRPERSDTCSWKPTPTLLNQ